MISGLGLCVSGSYSTWHMLRNVGSTLTPPHIVPQPIPCRNSAIEITDAIFLRQQGGWIEASEKQLTGDSSERSCPNTAQPLFVVIPLTLDQVATWPPAISDGWHDLSYRDSNPIRTCLLTINASLTIVQKSNEDWSAMLS